MTDCAVRLVRPGDDEAVADGGDRRIAGDAAGADDAAGVPPPEAGTARGGCPARARPTRRRCARRGRSRCAGARDRRWRRRRARAARRWRRRHGSWTRRSPCAAPSRVVDERRPGDAQHAASSIVIAGPSSGHASIFQLSSLTRTGSWKVRPPSDERAIAMSRTPPGKRCRQATKTSAPRVDDRGLAAEAHVRGDRRFDRRVRRPSTSRDRCPAASAPC